MEGVEDSDFAAIKGLDSKPRAEHTYDMVANRSIEAGEEVYNTYDSRGISNVELLCRYGFMLEGNSKDVISFEEDDVRTVCESLLSASNLENYVNRIGGRSPFVPASNSTTAASYPYFHFAKGNCQKMDVAIGPSLETRIDGHVIFASVQKLLEDAGIVQRSDRDEWVRTDDSKKDYAKGGAKEVNEVTLLDPAVGLDVVSTTLGTGPGQVKTRERVMATTKGEGDATSVGWAGAIMPPAVCVGKGPVPSSSAADARSPLPTRSVKDEQGAREALKEREMTSSPFASSSSSPLNVAGIQPGCDDDDEGGVLPSGRNSPLATARMEIDAEGLVSRALWTRLAREAYCRLMEAMPIIITTALSPSAGGPMDTSLAGWLASSSSPSLASPFSAGSTLMPIGEEWEDRNRPTQPLAFSGLERVEVQAHGQGRRDTYFRRRGDQDREGAAGNQSGVGPEGVVYEYGVEDEFGEVWAEKNRANREREKEKEAFPSFESDRVYPRKADRDFLSIRKRSRVASSFSDSQEEEEEESTFEESRKWKRPKLEEEETRMEVKSSLDNDDDEQEWEARKGEGNDARLEDARIQSTFVIEVVRLVSRLMEELCQRRLGEMWDGEEEERGGRDDLVLELATRYVTSERAVLQACMSSWLDLKNQLNGEPI
ncbi:hypothetical protein FRC14_002697 [Serendipita sp. 396]|nr:hypothetical protein FRC14_002697 [Serendipita sp. 396]KAG8789756.1 hypothetical protein FRC15_003825 [Serendipita sp. 397]KAG8804295.1 hypothetical protein FRC16_010624 [Serendipita sp. 398]KAG8819503.1 hypothetical protein FRC19_009733 [Serendipita sp. 401]KAG8877472.1 hypothetical protein FRC20_011141 [Serendipita sp. 405]KAG9052951.1 hypothetical protein FS842_008985 [Serendipita sp. 407]